MAEYADWDSVFRIGSHYICKDFLRRGFEVLWFQSYWNFLTPFVAWRGFKSLFRLWRLRSQPLERGLTGFSPFTFLPYRNFPLAKSMLFGSNSLRFTLPPVSWWLKRNGWRNVDLLWITSADLVNLSQMLNYQTLVYRITDNMTGFSHIPAGFRELEKKILTRADVVLATSREVARRAKKFNDHTYYLANAVDPEPYQGATPSPLLESISPPRIIYIGSLEYWFDYELIHEVAKLRPEYQFVLVGPPPLRATSGYAKLKLQSNIHFMGGKPPNQVPPLLKGAEVAVIPFRLTSLTHNVSPLKLYEYLAAGLPVVSTPLREVKASEAPVIFAGSALEFARGLDEALSIGKDCQEFLDFAAENSWEARLRRIEAILYGVGLPGFSEQGRRDSLA
jgi:glycosyltransferase involved in cell wall biosynthesis